MYIRQGKNNSYKDGFRHCTSLANITFAIPSLQPSHICNSIKWESLSPDLYRSNTYLGIDSQAVLHFVQRSLPIRYKAVRVHHTWKPKLVHGHEAISHFYYMLYLGSGKAETKQTKSLLREKGICRTDGDGLQVILFFLFLLLSLRENTGRSLSRHNKKPDNESNSPRFVSSTR